MDLEPVGPGDLPDGADGGYTLIEVVLALVLVMILVLSATKVLITATDRAAVLQQQQTAPLVANQAMERVRAVTASSTSSLATGLVAGRNAGDVTTQWGAASTPVLEAAWPVADPNAASGSAGAVLPLSSSAVVGATTYTVRTYLGVCERLRADVAAANCTKQAGGVAAAVPVGHVRMVRAVVEVSWAARAGSGCADRRCSYTVSALVDPSPDLTWNSNTAALTTTTTTTTTTGGRS